MNTSIEITINQLKTLSITNPVTEFTIGRDLRAAIFMESNKIQILHVGQSNILLTKSYGDTGFGLFQRVGINNGTNYSHELIINPRYAKYVTDAQEAVRVDAHNFDQFPVAYFNMGGNTRVLFASVMRALKDAIIATDHHIEKI